MAETLLATKLFIPKARPALVHRTQLNTRLSEGLHRLLTLISAPAGFGKTTLLLDWLNFENGTTNKFRSAWLSLDSGDNDPRRFLNYLIAALQTVDETLGVHAIQLLQTSQQTGVEAVLKNVINEIAELSDQIILILDDFHLIAAESVHHAIGYLIENSPPQLHTIILTREDPHLPLARYRVRDQLTELRAVDLRFSTDETAEFLNGVMGLSLAAEDIAALENRTEGWIAGLQLAAISLRGQANPSRMIESFTGSHRLVLDYLIEEVLSRQSESMQEFLLKTSILERLNGPLCDAVIGERYSQQTLEYLEQTNLFIVALDDTRNWYRYHHLFADLLQRRLKRTYPKALAGLHIQASQWYDQHGFTDEAIEHALKAQDLDRAADLAELAWRELNQGYRSAAWLGWVRMLPEELIRSRPMLSTGYAWALIDNGDLDGADLRFKDAERWLESQTDSDDLSEYLSFRKIVLDTEKLRSLAAWIANGRAYLIQARGDYPGTLKYAQQALEYLPEKEYFERGLADVLSGFAYWASGDLDLAYQSVVNAISNMKLLDNLTFIISFSSYLTDILIAQGNLHEAEKVFLELLDLLAAHGKPNLPAAVILYLGLSEIAFERGAFEEARYHLLTSQEFGELPNIPPWFRHSILARTRIKAIDGDLDGVVEILEGAEQLYYRHPIPDIRPLRSLTARAYLASGKLFEALQWASEEGLSVDDELNYLHEFDYITYAKILITQGRHEKNNSPIQEAIRLLERLLLAAQEGHRVKSIIEILVLLSLAYDGVGKLPSALKSLEHALHLAQPESFIAVFVNEGTEMKALLMRLSPDDYRFRAFLQKLIASFGTQKDSPMPFDQPLLDPLSEREIEVLALIAQGLTNQKIGERLYLSLNTVKVHTRNIYSKLGVNNRTQAVAQARAFGILAVD